MFALLQMFTTRLMIFISKEMNLGVVVLNYAGIRM